MFSYCSALFSFSKIHRALIYYTHIAICQPTYVCVCRLRNWHERLTRLNYFEKSQKLHENDLMNSSPANCSKTKIVCEGVKYQFERTTSVRRNNLV